MARLTGIAWTNATFNPWKGCTQVSPACNNCYARTMLETNRKSTQVVWGKNGTRVRTKTWNDPIKWNREAKDSNKRLRVFCSSIADVFDDHASIQQEWRDDLWRLISNTPNLDWQLLTKRPELIQRFLPSGWNDGWSNVWLGTTVEDQHWADKRIPELLKVPAVVRFLSCEPLLGPIDLSKYLAPDKISWVIAGGEKTTIRSVARPMKLEWACGIRDECAKTGTAFFFKQWGNHDSAGNEVGSKRAGVLLNGIKHHAWPVNYMPVNRNKKNVGRPLKGSRPTTNAERLRTHREKKLKQLLTEEELNEINSVVARLVQLAASKDGGRLEAIRKLILFKLKARDG
jgi:protein gp37